jgi:hypothetical protein
LFEAILKKNRCKCIVIILSFLYSFSTVYANQHDADTVYKDRKAVVVIANFISLEEFLNMENMRKLMEQSAVGLMNTRGAGKTDSIRAHATLGWGSRADALASHCIIEQGNNVLFVKNIEQVKAYNRNNPYNVKVGALGDFFHQQGLKTALLGNQDVEDIQCAPAGLIAMDSDGIIDNGDVGKGLLLPTGFKGEYKTDFDYLYELFKNLYATNNLIVIDTGDTSRLEYFQNKNQVSSLDKKRILQNIDSFIGRIINTIDQQNTLFIIVSPQYSSAAAKLGKKLSPVVFFYKDIDAGLLISNTTRRPGIIGNVDIAPSIADFFGGTLEGITGEVIKVQKVTKPLEKIFNLYNLTAFNSKNRGIVLKSYLSFQIVLLVLTLMFILRSNTTLNVRYIDKLNMVLRTLILFTLICPLALFLLSLLKVYHLLIYTVLLISFNCILVYMVSKFLKNKESRIICIAGFTMLVILIDLVIDGPLNKTSLLGYDAIIGARYYGLGNEYMGIMIATSLISIVPLVYKRIIPQWVAVTAFIFVVLIIGLSMFGANVGGTITASMAFGFAIFNLYHKKITIKKMIGLMLIIILIISLFAVYDIFFSQHKSHLAKAIIEFRTGGVDIILNIIHRKLEMNLKLLRWTIWSKVLLVSVFVVGVLAFRPQGVLHTLLNKYKSFSIAWYAIIVASLVGMLVNDSGVVVAATSNIFLIFSLLYFLLEEEVSGIQEIRKNRT